MYQLLIRVPESLADAVEIVSLKENGDKTILYDQLCYGYRSYFEGPFQITAKLKVKKRINSLENFKLFAYYQALGEFGSLQPLWHEVVVNEQESALR
jgi:hypothetical protein